MSEINERELRRVRLRFLDVIKSFFAAEPDAATMSRWRGTFSALAGQQINPDLDGVVQELGAKLDGMTLQQLQDEYYQLFADPFAKSRVYLEASYYRDGRVLGPTLVEFRDFLNGVGMVKDKHFKDAEDSLVFMLDVLAGLVAGEKDALEATRDSQDVLVQQFIGPLAEEVSKTLSAHDGAHFYAACGRFLTTYLELEQGLVA